MVGTVPRGRVRVWGAVAAMVAALLAPTAAAAAAAPVKPHAPSTAAPRKQVRPNVALPEEQQLRGGFVAAGPTRVLDTRTGTGTKGVVARLGQIPLLLKVDQITGNPSVRPTAVVLNVTVTDATAASYLAVYQPDGQLPNSSSLNFAAGRTVANEVVVPVSSSGEVAFYNHAGRADVIADLAGYFTLDKAAATYSSEQPIRVLDTRNGTGIGGRAAKVGAGRSVSLHLAGTHGVPADASAVVLNLTATDPSASGYLTAYPDGGQVPTASSVNFVPGQTVPNLVTVPLGADGSLDVFNHAGTTDVVADLEGYYLKGAPRTGGVLKTLDLANRRILDTRSGLGTGKAGKVGAGRSVSLSVSNTISGPAKSIGAVLLNVTVTDPTANSYLTVYPDGTTVPTASNVNFVAGQTIPNMVVVPVGADGRIDFFNHSGSTDVVADILGYIETGASPQLAAIGFTDRTVDATGGTAAVNLTWTVTDADPAATQTGGEVVIRQKGDAPDTYVGRAYIVDYMSTQDMSGFGGATLVSGNAASSSYSYTFAVPRYAGATQATWTVSLVTVFENNTQQESVLAGSALDGFGATLTATTQVSTVTPTYQDPVTFSSSIGGPAYLYDGVNNSAEYSLELQDSQSGLWKGTLTLTGPGGRTLSGSFEELEDEGQTSGLCQHDVTDATCYVVVEFPAGTAAGTWSVSSVLLTNNAGQTHTYSGLDETPLTVTSNATLSATGFAATPNPVNTWQGNAQVRTSMRVSGAVGGLSSVQLFWQGSCPSYGPATPSHNADGTWSVTTTVYQSDNGRASACHLVGAILVDGAGNTALYGPDFSAPDPQLTIAGVTDTTPPTVSSAKLNTTSLAQSQIGSVPVHVTAKVSDPTAPVNQSSSSLYDSKGTVVGEASGGGQVGADGTMTIAVDVPNGLTPGTYTVGFSVTDAGWLTTRYGGPNGKAVPGGPLVLTVTSG